MPFEEGNKLGGRTPGAKNKATLLKEERRALFDQWMQDKFKEAVNTAKPEYLLDQYLGKATDKVELKAEVQTGPTVSTELLEAAEELLKIRKLNADPGRTTSETVDSVFS